MEYSKPNTPSGCWEYDFDPDAEELVLMRSNRPNKSGMKQMLTSLEGHFAQDEVGQNNLRLILSAPLMYETLLKFREALSQEPEREPTTDPGKRLVLQLDLKDALDNALMGAEKFDLSDIEEGA